MNSKDPVIIQGGMGAGVSNWRLARAVSQVGQLGVVSGTALDHILARRLQDGDPGGYMRLGLDHFPASAMADSVWQRYYIPGGKAQNTPYKPITMHSKNSPQELIELCVIANFVEVFLAKHGHGNPVGINYLEKIQLPHLFSIYGAMLAGVDYVLMGAGIPLKIPGVLNKFVHHETASYPLHVTGAREGDDTVMTFTPWESMQCGLAPLKRPRFLAIIASDTLAVTLLKKANGKVDGFIIEGPTAGGHNAPPRGKFELNALGEPIYGERDKVDLARIRALGVPFWLAGGQGSAAKLNEALEAGAAGIQVGTVFAFCDESGLCDDYKQTLLKEIAAGNGKVFTDAMASPTGFPFKVALLEESLSDSDVYLARQRVCDLGYLREAYRTDAGKIDFRCAGEPVATYVAKGGKAEDTVRRKCLCNALVANIGHPQVRNGNYIEKGLVTSGDELAAVGQFLGANQFTYSAADVVAKLLRVDKSGCGGRAV